MAYFEKRTRQSQEKILLNGGINTFLEESHIDRSECISNSNLSSDKYPCLSVRKGRKKYATAIISPNGMGTYWNVASSAFHIHVADSSTWKYWNGSTYTTVGTISNERSNFLNFNTSLKNYMVLINGTSIKYWDGTTMSTASDAPVTTLYCIDDRRLYALKDNTIYWSAGGSLTDWTSSESGHIEINGSKGKEKALVSYNDTVIAFFDESMHILYGNDVFDYDLSKPIDIGCVSERAFIELENILYFCYKDGLYKFSGGLPEKISNKVNYYFDNIADGYMYYTSMGKHKKKIYISLTSSLPGNSLTLEYDTFLNVWNIHNAQYYVFTTLGNKLIGLSHYLTEEGKIWDINGYSEGFDYESSAVAFNSEWVSGWISYGTISRNKKLTKQYYLLYLPVGSSLTLYYSLDGSTWTSLKTFDTSISQQVVKVHTLVGQLNNVARFKLKLVGVGNWYISKIDEYFRIKKRE